MKYKVGMQFTIDTDKRIYKLIKCDKCMIKFRNNTYKYVYYGKINVLIRCYQYNKFETIDSINITEQYTLQFDNITADHLYFKKNKEEYGSIYTGKDNRIMSIKEIDDMIKYNNGKILK